ncbi:Dihydroorotate dehydrogenase [Mesorhizobium escarrei]|uniref:Dihydroorotate dehydrogenase n=2 Tax=Mesorhizobium escarrei TaxID=666018 RepID=A0ABN8JX06_9HYPH|nr:Dihydroorotate dehydrogenase [Mesorhizobium escarrei]
MVGSDYSAIMSQNIYKIVPERLWREAERNGRFTGAPIDVADGFIHFSTAGQAKETAAKHFAGQTGLLLVAIDGARLGDALKYEVSRGGALFPHLYGPLDLNAVVSVQPLPLGTDGLHQFPMLEAE